MKMSRVARVLAVGALAVTLLTLASGPLSAAASAAPVPAGFRAISITWVTQVRGWVLGVAPCHHASTRTCTNVISTSNGGATWTQAGQIPAPTPPAGDATTGVTRIRFSTPAIGWAFGPDLYRTTDGGRSWTRQQIGGAGTRQVLALATTATAAYAVTSPCAYQSGGSCKGPGLSVWRAQALTRGPWVKTPLTLPFSDAADVSAFGSTVYADDATQDGSHLYASTNGGSTFASRPVPCDDSQGIELVQAVASSATKVALLCVGNAGIGKADKTVYRSADTGKTSTSAGTMGPYGIFSQLAVSPSGNLLVAAASAMGSFLYVNDSGDGDWSMPVGIDDGGLGWGDMAYVTDNEAFVVYSPGNSRAYPVGTVYATHDGGRHWTIAGL
ncbi:MAG TPA: hypothetical protein VMG38_07975 [Trebonia sp.]|nr:hypothetical protein [Trebonia sp.]